MMASPAFRSRRFHRTRSDGFGHSRVRHEGPGGVARGHLRYLPGRTRRGALAAAAKGGFQPKAVKDFRDILADKSIDAVCISTPDHWCAYMAAEACKAGKDVWVEKPAATHVDEAQKMVQAARKYNRVVQAGTMQRSGGYFKKAAELAAAGTVGEVTFCHTFQSGSTQQAGYGNPPDSDPPPDLDWDMWLGEVGQDLTLIEIGDTVRVLRCPSVPNPSIAAITIAKYQSAISADDSIIVWGSNFALEETRSSLLPRAEEKP